VRYYHIGQDLNDDFFEGIVAFCEAMEEEVEVIFCEVLGDFVSIVFPYMMGDLMYLAKEGG